MTKATVRDLLANLAAMEDCLNGSDKALINARADIYNAGQHDDYLTVSEALLKIRKELTNVLAMHTRFHQI